MMGAPVDELTIAEAIHADLVRQSQEGDYDAPWVDEFHDLANTNVDGHVNLLELARAIIAAIGQVPDEVREREARKYVHFPTLDGRRALCGADARGGVMIGLESTCPMCAAEREMQRGQ